MRFFEKHLTKDSLKNTPHKWILAFLVMPIHAGELHYKKKYHLQYAHAKKLFVFDMLLLASTFIIFGLTLFWHFYDPTITSEVYLSVDSSPSRVRSGETVEVVATYKNESEQNLLNPKLHVRLPAGFVTTYTTSTQGHYDEASKIFVLPHLSPDDEGTILLRARAISEPEREQTISADLTYTPEESGNVEVKTVHYGITSRGSVLEGKIDALKEVFASQKISTVITLKNTGKEILEHVALPLNISEFISFSNPRSEFGFFDKNMWRIDKLDPDQSITIEGDLVINPNQQTNQTVVKLTPIIEVNGGSFVQVPIEHSVNILHPSIEIESRWNTTGVKPGSTAEMIVILKNTGDINLQNVSVSIPAVKGIVDAGQFATLNKATVQNGAIILNQNNRPQLLSLPRGQTKEISVQIPIVSAPSGSTNLQLSLPLIVRAFAESNTTPVTKETASAKLNIGTQLSASAEARYFTDDGEQLGRGPLPPTVGKETKYWIFVTIQNSTSDISGIAFSARLPAQIVWTGKSSVSQGQDISYNASTRTVSWSANALLAHATVGLYMEVSYTPDSSDVGTIPLLLEHMNVSGTDVFINESIQRNLGSIRADLRNDDRGREMGVEVVEITEVVE